MTQRWLYGKLLGGSREVMDSSREWSPSLLQLVSVMPLPHKCVFHNHPCSPSLCLWGEFGWGAHHRSLSHQTACRDWAKHAQTWQSLDRAAFHWEELSRRTETRTGGLEGRSSSLWETSAKRSEGFLFQPANPISYEQQALCQLPEQLEFTSLPWIT
jgi:hypothetical protein